MVSMEILWDYGLKLFSVKCYSCVAITLFFPTGHQPQSVHFYWVVQHGDVDAFQWFLHQIGELEDEVTKQKDLAAAAGTKWTNSCIMHLFVTRADQAAAHKVRREMFIKEKLNYDPRGPELRFSVEKLYREMMSPAVPSTQLRVVMQQSIAIQRLSANNINMQQDVWVWAGRPEWDGIFKHITNQARDNKIGVFVSSSLDSIIYFMVF